MLFQLLFVITFFFFFVSSMYVDQSHALQSPENCFEEGVAGASVCGITFEYPLTLHRHQYSKLSCGYPGFELSCPDEERPIINISNHIYYVKKIDYLGKFIQLVDTELDENDCPQPKRNFSLPSSPSWLHYDLSGNYNLTIFSNCSSVPVNAKQHLLCSQDHYNTANTPPSYALYPHELANAPDDWYANCTENVVVPVGLQNTSVANYTHALEYGFYMDWNAIDWCGACEGSGGQCWSSLHNQTGCACRDNMSYNRSCQQPPRHQGVPPPPQHNIKGVLAGFGILLLIALLIFYGRVSHSFSSILNWWNKNKSPINMEVFLERYSLQRYKYSDIKKMTSSFKDAIGKGGYGRVFKGELRDGRLVAVKVLNDTKGDGEDFINEVATIGMTNHVNVVNLVGFCIEGTRRALVYEFMSNGSLERFIYTPKESSTTLPLNWEQLYQIALGIARGLEYLHRGCNTHILHFDIKPANILLDENLCPKISDFGLAKFYQTRQSIVSTVGVRGTMGYIAPELCYRTFGNVSHKSDVYSYGMMMLEMIGGRKNIDATVDNISEIYFPLWIYNQLKRINDASGLEEIQASDVFDDEKTKKMIIVALWCIQAHPTDRPSMSKVVEMLEGSTLELQMPPNPSVDPRSSSTASS